MRLFRLPWTDELFISPPRSLSLSLSLFFSLSFSHPFSPLSPSLASLFFLLVAVVVTLAGINEYVSQVAEFVRSRPQIAFGAYTLGAYLFVFVASPLPLFVLQG